MTTPTICTNKMAADSDVESELDYALEEESEEEKKMAKLISDIKNGYAAVCNAYM